MGIERFRIKNKGKGIKLKGIERFRVKDKGKGLLLLLININFTYFIYLYTLIHSFFTPY